MKPYIHLYFKNSLATSKEIRHLLRIFHKMLPVALVGAVLVVTRRAPQEPACARAFWQQLALDAATPYFQHETASTALSLAASRAAGPCGRGFRPLTCTPTRCRILHEAVAEMNRGVAILAEMETFQRNVSIRAQARGKNPYGNDAVRLVAEWQPFLSLRLPTVGNLYYIKGDPWSENPPPPPPRLPRWSASLGPEPSTLAGWRSTPRYPWRRPLFNATAFVAAPLVAPVWQCCASKL